MSADELGATARLRCPFCAEPQRLPLRNTDDYAAIFAGVCISCRRELAVSISRAGFKVEAFNYENPNALWRRMLRAFPRRAPRRAP